MKNKGITLVALVITIIVLLILSGVTISALSGENGIITNAVKAKKMTTLSQCKEEYEMFITEEMIKNNKFQKTSLVAGENNLYFNTQKSGEVGNIFIVIPSLKNNEYSKKLEIIKGDLLLNTKDPKEIELAQSVGIKPNPYDIVNGELLSSDGNLLLMDKTGTLTIPDRVTKIGEGAFANVSGLKTIIIPGSVKIIETNAFRNNSTLEKVIIKEGVEQIKHAAFNSCTKLEEVIMPDSVNSIGSQVFYYCVNLKNVRLSKNIKVIPSWGFCGCGSLEKIELPQNIESIKTSAFSSCSRLNNVVIGKNIKEIASDSFNGCNVLDNIDTKNNNNFIYENGMLMTKMKDNIIFISSKELQKSNVFEIPEGVVKFDIKIASNRNITIIKIPSSLQKIISGEGMLFPSTVTNIEVNPQNQSFVVKNNALYSKDEKKLIVCFDKGNTVDLLPTVETIGRNALDLAPNLTELALPNSVRNIESFAITNCNKLQTMRIGENISYIDPLFKYNSITLNLIIDPLNPNYSVEDYVLYNKDKTKLITTLKEFSGVYTIKDTVKVIGERAFHGKKKITEVILPDGLEEIKDSFNHCNFKEVVIPSTVKTINDWTFSENPNLDKIIINKPKDSIQGAPWGAMKGMRVIEWKP